MKTIILYLENAVVKFIAAILLALIVIGGQTWFDNSGKAKIPELQSKLTSILSDTEKLLSEIRAIQNEIDDLKKQKTKIDAEIEQRKKVGGLTRIKNSYLSAKSMAVSVKIKRKEIEYLDPNSRLVNLNKQKDDISSEIALANRSYLVRFQENFRAKIFSYVLFFFFILLIEPIFKALFLYYIVGSYIEKRPPVRSIAPNENYARIKMPNADPSLFVQIKEGEHFYLRGGWCKERANVTTKTKLMWRWNAPLITFAANLFELVDYSANGSSGEITITSPESDLFIGEIDLTGTNGFVIRPKYLIGVTNRVKIKTIWNFSLHNILSGRIRQIVLHGDGRIIVSGAWGIDIKSATSEKNHRIEFPMLLGYDAQADYSLCRTETFWHYFRKEAGLFDIKIQNGNFITQKKVWTYTKKDAIFIEKFFDTFINGVGSILGL